MSFEISPKGQDYLLEIREIGYQTLSKSDIRSLLENLVRSPISVNIKGIQLFLRADEKRDELKSVLSSAISLETSTPVEIQNSDEEEELSEFDEEEEAE